MEKSHSSKPVIFFALSANLFISAIKLIVSILTHSTAMLAESIHSLADSFNQVFLLVGIKLGEKRANELHPFGFSGELYFWSFIVAIILFSAGAVFSIYEGIHRLQHPSELKNIEYAFIVLAISFFAEGAAFIKANKKINSERGGLPIIKYLKKTKKSELLVIFLEDFAALTGLSVAIIALLLQHFTGILIFDGIASILIGVILAVVALFLGNETRSLLIGESADPKLINSINEIFKKEENIKRVIHLRSLQMGPDDILLAAKIEFDHRLNMKEISNIINAIEAEIRGLYPQLKKIFIEPDIYKENYL